MRRPDASGRLACALLQIWAATLRCRHPGAQKPRPADEQPSLTLLDTRELCHPGTSCLATSTSQVFRHCRSSQLSCQSNVLFSGSTYKETWLVLQRQTPVSTAWHLGITTCIRMSHLVLQPAQPAAEPPPGPGLCAKQPAPGPQLLLPAQPPPAHAQHVSIHALVSGAVHDAAAVCPRTGAKTDNTSSPSAAEQHGFTRDTCGWQRHCMCPQACPASSTARPVLSLQQLGHKAHVHARARSQHINHATLCQAIPVVAHHRQPERKAPQLPGQSETHRWPGCAGCCLGGLGLAP